MQRLAMLIIAASFTAGAAFAHETGQEEILEDARNESGNMFDFERHDANGDGYLTEAEWQDAGNTANDFANVDENEDGYLDEDEVHAYANARPGQVTPEDDFMGTGHDPLSQDAADNEPVSQATEAAAADGVDREMRRQADPAAAETSPIDNSLFASRERDAEQSLTRMDSSGDGRISRQEAEQDEQARRNFVAWDSNQDGYLDQDEIDTGRRVSQEDVSFRDNDRDGRISREETDADEFDTLDANNDGYLDPAEISYEPGERTIADAAGFQDLDTDGDARLSRSEAANDSHVDVNFDTWDNNGDGYLEEEEVNNGWLEESSATPEETW